MRRLGVPLRPISGTDSDLSQTARQIGLHVLHRFQSDGDAQQAFA